MSPTLGKLIISKKLLLNFNHLGTIPQRLESWFSHIEMGPPDAILSVSEHFKADKNPNKINLSVGGYRDDDDQPYVLPEVREAERRIFESKMDKEYALIQGIPEFCKAAITLAIGEDHEALERAATVQTISGTGGLFIGNKFFEKFFCGKDIYFSNPTWLNHIHLAKQTHLIPKEYKYYDPNTHGLDFVGFCESLKSMPEKSLVVMQVCSHNPTGVEPNIEQWKEISYIMKKRTLFPYFDMAYQGFSTGDLNKDVAAVRLFLADGHQLALVQGFSKNMGLYGERVGALSIIGKSPKEAAVNLSHLLILIRGNYSSPPIHGARIATTILTDSKLYQQWLGTVKTMADRVISSRELLKCNLIKVGSTRNWDHVTNQMGMFFFSGLKPNEVERLKNEFGVYICYNGRVYGWYYNKKC